MKWMLLIIPILSFANTVEKNDTIVNDTKKEMLCVANYSSVYAEKEIDGRKRRVEVEPKKEVLKIIQPNTSFKKERQGNLICFNELSKIQSYDRDNTIERTNERTLQSHLANHNRYDLTQYEGKNRAFVENNFGIAQRCAPLGDNQYCNHGFGLDIIYDKNQKIKTVLLYGNTVQRGTLPFTPQSIMKLRNNEGPLGLWVVKNYKKLFSKKPNVYTKNLMMWEDLSKHIKRVIVTPSKGYFELSYTVKDGHNLFQNGRIDAEKAEDYIQAIEVQYQ